MNLRSLFRSVVEWLQPARRVQPEPRITPEQLREALSEMLADPETRKLIVQNFVGTVLPITGGSPMVAADVCPGTGPDDNVFGKSGPCGSTSRAYKFEANTTTTIPLTVQGVSGQNVNLQEWKKNDGTVLALVDKDGRVGIGPTAPNVKLSLGTDITAQKLALFDGTGDFYGLGVQSGRIVIHTANTERMTVTFDGKVGIGTTTPNVKLSLGTDITAQKLALSDGQGDFYGLGVQVGRIVIHTANSERMTITSAGNVGIGTTAPGEKLEIAGSAYVNQEGAGFLWDAAGLKRAGLIKQSGFNPEIRYLSTIGLGIRRVTTGTLVAPTASDLPLILETDGNVSTAKLNQVVFLKPSGGNDSDQINNAIAALPSENPSGNNGGIIVLLPGVYQIQTPLLVNKDGVKLRGYGGNRTDAPPNLDRPRTKFQWVPNAGAPDDPTVLKLQSPVGRYIQDLEVSDLTIDGAGGDAVDPKAAAIGLHVDHVYNSLFRNVHIRNMKKRKTPDPPAPQQIGGVGIKISGQVAGSCDWNVFENCSAVNVSLGIVLEGVGPAHNTFIAPTAFIWGSHAEDVGIWLKECDNCRFYGAQTGLLPGTLGNGVVIESPGLARANYFYHLQAGGGFKVKTAPPPAPVPSSKNLIFGYDRENGEPIPASEPDTDVTKFLFWIDSNGNIRGGT